MYRADCPFVILVTGLPGSGKTTYSKKLAELLNATVVNGDDIRNRTQDFDMSPDGRLRQMRRMKWECRMTDAKVVIADFICPTKALRDELAPDMTIFIDHPGHGRFEDTNALYERPENPQVVVKR